ncbi:uncharacterized protein LOC112564555 [Pomacea canaliculata]|uniref:uncharacterized protein LOC112564555 n=1 Tax=Pomacea canaliculata TaxID=400727 RepID=UPI000D734BB9|nr:uncharacterized protein LOC112564555 [Pomacea canaliculata]
MPGKDFFTTMKSFGETLLIILTSSPIVGCLQNEIFVLHSNTTIKSPESSVAETEREGIEKEVLGPLRIWHIVFIVGSVILVVLTVVCCCMEIRIPRTRTEIEENYHKRRLNEKYLHQLERTPDVILRKKISPQHEKKGARRANPKPAPEGRSASKGISQHQHHQEVPPVASRAARPDHGRPMDKQAMIAKIARRQMYGVQNPLALSAVSLLQGRRQQQQQQHD